MGAPAKKESSEIIQSISQRKKIGEVLVEMGFLSEADLNKHLDIAKKSKMRIGEYLVAQKLITEDDLAKVISAQFMLPYEELNHFEPDRDALKIVPENLARRYLVLPLKMNNGVLVFCAFDPMNILNLDSIKKLVTVPFEVHISSKTKILEAMDKAYSKTGSIEDLVDLLAEKEDKKEKKNASPIPVVRIAKSDEPSIEALVNRLIEEAIEAHGSDVHIDPSSDQVRVRVRIDGVLRETNIYPIQLHNNVVSRIKVLSQMDIAEKRMPQDGRFHYPYGEDFIDVRVSSMPTTRGEKVVMRLLNKAKLKLDLNHIGLTKKNNEKIKWLLSQPYGMVLVTGPTGSGKTTTIYSMIAEVSDIETNIITVEDPVEYDFDIVNQVQVHEKAGVHFHTVLRNILRQDPDILMIGEIRDKETAEIAIRGSLTGHLVLSTLHTNNAVSTSTRLVDMGVEPFLVSTSVIGVVGQRLVRVLCGHCKKESKLTKEDIMLLGVQGLQAGKKIFRATGCNKCFNSGYSGRIPLFEILIPDPTLRKMIHEKKNDEEQFQYVRKTGFETMKEDGIRKVLAGLTTIEELLKSVV